MKHKKTAGFTFIELLVSATIIIVLSVIGVVSFTKAGKSARDARRKADLAMVQQAMVQYKVNEGGSYPAGDFTTVVGILQSPTYGYLSTGTIEDPKNDAAHFYACTGCDGTKFTLSVLPEADNADQEDFTFSNP